MKYLVKLAYAVMVEAASEAIAEEIALETIGEEARTKITITEVNEKVPFPPEELKTPQEQLSFYDEYFKTHALKVDELHELGKRVSLLSSKHKELKEAAIELLADISFESILKGMAEACDEKKEAKMEANKNEG